MALGAFGKSTEEDSQYTFQVGLHTAAVNTSSNVPTDSNVVSS